MRTALLRQLKRPFRLEAVRFFVVGGFGELLYLGLFALVNVAGGSSLVAVAVAGGVCLLVNAVLHARFSFRVRFHRGLLARYAAIQLLGFVVSLAAARVLQELGMGAPVIAVATVLLWAGTSYGLTRRSYR